MALQQVVVSGRCDLPISPCSNVVVCLESDWAERTETGYPLIFGEVTAINRVQQSINRNCCTTYKFCKEYCEYTVQYDDEQLLTDPDTDEPYVVESDDTEGISAEYCVTQALINGPST